ncbi:MAG TPA: SUMF1/EgtB/PvdO family nonheme iron enzyme [Solirubrobacteraceae bacterium]|nr:SUMF1/EgtB/PvdO family nonheme iron enzyme [Solirubrobacteraceae bacterium]
MAARAVKTSSPPPSADVAQALVAMGDARERTLALLEHLDEEQIERVHSPIMSPLAWDLGHIAAYEDLWLAHRYGGLELLRPELADMYDAFETPRSVRGEIAALGASEAGEYMATVSARTAEVLRERGLGDGVLCEMVLRHELQHSETMRQTLAIAGLLPAPERDKLNAQLSEHDAPEGWLELPAGEFAMGAHADGFAYDNERPCHLVELPAFALARRPVSNASWMRFSEGGGYERREWWSREGWAWKEQQDITHHPSIAAGHPEAPACHVSWFEADAFARAHRARLPTEAEWERAATWTQASDSSAHTAGDTHVVGVDRPAGAGRANGLVGAGRANGLAGVDRAAGAGRANGLAGVGRVWEWTSSYFAGYPGFVAYPYREYSQVFFGRDYRVLRGGSWATHPRVACVTFRNWDLPQRRQIFAGVRLARDVR